jgi:hypothetical protein
MTGFEFDELSVALSYALLCGAGAKPTAQAPAAKEAKKETPKVKAEAPAVKESKEEFDDLFGDEEEPTPAPAPVAKADELDNMFGDDDDGETAEERAATKARQVQ